MTITITLKGALLTIIALLCIVLLVYLIVLLSNLIKTMKKTNEILGDAKVITEVAADKAVQLDQIIDGASKSVGTVVDTLKGNQSIVAAVTNIVNAASSFTGIVKNKEDKKSKSKGKNQDKEK